MGIQSLTNTPEITWRRLSPDQPTWTIATKETTPGVWHSQLVHGNAPQNVKAQGPTKEASITALRAQIRDLERPTAHEEARRALVDSFRQDVEDGLKVVAVAGGFLATIEVDGRTFQFQGATEEAAGYGLGELVAQAALNLNSDSNGGV